MGDDCLLWSEHEPNLYKLRIDIDGDMSEHIIGMREFMTEGGKFTINGEKTFLRGKHDGMIFPKTAFAPTDLEEWLRVMKISKSYGMNHYRYHTCCPPEAALSLRICLEFIWSHSFLSGELSQKRARKTTIRRSRISSLKRASIC